MIFVTTAGEIQAAWKAGLELIGTHPNGQPMYDAAPAEKWEEYLKEMYGN